MANQDDELRKTSGGAVFGLYPQLADNQRTLHATGNRLRQGVQAVGGDTFAPTAAVQTPIAASPTSPTRLDASTDPRSFIGGAPRRGAASLPAPTPALQAGAPGAPALPGSSMAAAAQDTPPSTLTDVQRGGGTVAAAPAAGLPVGGAPGVQKSVVGGRTLYSDGTNPASDASLMARGPISSQNMAAADALASHNDGTAAARGVQFAQQAAGAQAANAAGAANGQRVEQQMERERLLKFATDTPSRSRASGAMGLVANSANTQANERTAEAQLGFRGQELAQRTTSEAARLGVDRGRLGVDQARLGIDTRKAGNEQQAQQQLLAAQQALTSATTPEERAAAEDNLRALQGKYERTAPNRFTVVPGGKDEAGNVTPAQVINNQTGEFVPQPGRPASGAPIAEGSISTVNGRTARFTNGKWVPQ